MKAVLLTLTLGLAGLWMCAQQYQVEPLSCNSPYMDYAPVMHAGGLVFSSNRPDGGMVAVVDSLGNPTSSLYYVALAKDGSPKKVRPFAPEINTKLSEGASCFTSDHKAFYFTATITGGDESKQRLGIFHSRQSLGVWSVPKPLPFNSEKQDYDVAHPAVSPDGHWLVFSSNMDAPESPADLFVCERVGEAWSSPVRMPQGVNGEGREVFPSFDHFGRLYFSSDRSNGRSDLDVYYTMRNRNGVWVEPVALPGPINSTADDFGMTFNPSGDAGFFSSNRDGVDDLFAFTYAYPTFSGCAPHQDPPLCYALEETSITPLDSMPFRYVWELGDGQEAEGFYVEHCFPGVGTYNISFNVYDTLTGEHYARVTETELVIAYMDGPYIQCPDTVLAGEPVWFEGDYRGSDSFEVDQFFWDTEGARHRGAKAMHVFETPGTYPVQLGALSIPEHGRTRTACTQREVVVMAPGTWQPPGKPWLESLSDVLERTGQDAPINLEDPIDSSLFFVAFAEREQPLALSDNYFDKIDREITERFDPADSTFHYSIGQVQNIAELMQVHRALRDSGYGDALVQEASAGAFEAQIQKTGYFMPDSVRQQINQQINSFANIQFDYNSDRITPESYKNLEYILAVLRVEPQIRLWIKAHTDDTGTPAFNLDLSERRATAVEFYFTSRGIPIERFDLTGYGSNRPVATNETEEGRSRNRRVEFEIRLEDVREASQHPEKQP